MAIQTSIVEVVRGELRKEPRIVPHLHALSLHYDNGLLFMEGELNTIAAKRLALERAARLCCVLGIVDRLRVSPTVRMSDSEVAGLLGAALMQESMFSSPRGAIDFAVEDGVVTLTGEVASQDHKRLAGVLAWWIPGSRDVINAIAVEPPEEEEDTDSSMAQAVRMVLRKDPFLAAGQVHVAATEGIILLSGFVTSRAERNMAENDAWYVFGVDGVDNAITVSRHTGVNQGY